MALSRLLEQERHPVFFRGNRWTSNDALRLEGGAAFVERASGQHPAEPLHAANAHAAEASAPPASSSSAEREFLLRQHPPSPPASGADLPAPPEASLPKALSDVQGTPPLLLEAHSSAATATAAVAAAAAAAASAEEPSGSFLQVLSSADACASSAGSMGLRVRQLLSWGALGLLAVKMVIRRDRSRRPKRVLLLDFLSTVAAWQLLELWPPYELPAPTVARASEGSLADSCDIYAAALLIEELLWLFTLKVLMRQAEKHFGYRQGEYLLESTDWVEQDTEAPGGASLAACRRRMPLAWKRSASKRLLLRWGIDWCQYFQQLVVLLICVAAAQLVTLLLLLLLAAPLAPIVAAPLWLLHRDNASLRRFIVALACPMCTDLVQFCSLDALIRRRPPPLAPVEDSDTIGLNTGAKKAPRFSRETICKHPPASPAPTQFRRRCKAVRQSVRMEAIPVRKRAPPRFQGNRADCTGTVKALLIRCQVIELECVPLANKLRTSWKHRNGTRAESVLITGKCLPGVWPVQVVS
ncbi:uncharacterized protein LOC34617575 [Cyclospora cayetanensis]|uniref:Uncharacterized protein LOC34617575 n=1 Tax=Cyclospora cayetanensis TaxID=88456 RepID=A0A6P6RZK7_9EIME|nr:uncharacterized protein LOC34617575 [Cyclospora cayetanensis]